MIFLDFLKCVLRAERGFLNTTFKTDELEAILIFTIKMFLA